MQKKLSRLGWRNILIMLLAALMIANPMIVYLYMDNIMKSEISEREEQISELLSTIEEMTVRQEELEASISSLRDELTSLKTLLAKREEEIREMEEIMVNASRLLSEKEEEIQELRSMVDIIQSELERLLEGLPANTSLISLFPWITMSKSIKDGALTVSFIVENNIGRKLTFFRLTYRLWRVLGEIKPASLEFNETLFKGKFREENRIMQASFKLHKHPGLEPFKSTNLTIFYSVSSVIDYDDEVEIIPKPYSIVDRDYDQIHDLLEDMLTRTAMVSVVIGFRDELLENDIKLFESLGGEVTIVLPIIDGFSGEISGDNLTLFRDQVAERLEFIDPTVEFTYHLRESTKIIGAKRVWNNPPPFNFYGDNWTSVAIIDTGIDPNHNHFENVLRDSANFSAPPVYPGTYPPVEGDYEGHGSMVAGIIAGGFSSNYPGVAKNTSLIMLTPIKLLNIKIEEMLNWIIDHKYVYNIVVINLSGGSMTYLPLVERAIRRLIRNGVMFVKSAGNDWQYMLSTTFPREARAIVVGAVDKNDRIAVFSSNGWPVSIVAPGDKIISVKSSTQGSYE